MGIHPGNSTACAGRQAVQFHGCNPGWFNRFLLGPLENPEKNRLMEKSLQLFPIFGPIRAAFLWKSGEVFGGNFHDFTQQVKHIHKLTHGNSFLSGVTKNTGFKRFVGVDFLWNLCLQKKQQGWPRFFPSAPKFPWETWHQLGWPQSTWDLSGWASYRCHRMEWVISLLMRVCLCQRSAVKANVRDFA